MLRILNINIDNYRYNCSDKAQVDKQVFSKSLIYHRLSFA